MLIDSAQMPHFLMPNVHGCETCIFPVDEQASIQIMLHTGEWALRRNREKLLHVGSTPRVGPEADTSAVWSKKEIGGPKPQVQRWPSH